MSDLHSSATQIAAVSAINPVRATSESARKPAAFVRFEGVCTPKSALLAAGWLAANAQEIRQRIWGLSSVALAVPLRLAGSFADPVTVNRLAWMALRGMSEDRLIVLAGDFAESTLRPSLRRDALGSIAKARARGEQIVLVSECVAELVKPLMDEIGADTLLANHLEVRNGKLTGRLDDPVLGGALGGSPLQALAGRLGIDLQRSSAYGAHAADGALLASVARPCAVCPDSALRRLARDLDWPVVEIS